jgi:hypothetical protein
MRREGEWGLGVAARGDFEWEGEGEAICLTRSVGRPVPGYLFKAHPHVPPISVFTPTEGLSACSPSLQASGVS